MVEGSQRRGLVRGNPLVLFGVVLFLAVLLTAAVTEVWPGEARLTTRNHTLCCAGPQGEHTEIGFLRPLLVLLVAHMVLVTALLAVVVLLIVVRAKLTGRRYTPPALPPEPEPGPV